MHSYNCQAVVAGNEPIVQKIIAEAPQLVRQSNLAGSFPVHCAAGNSAISKLLVKSGADLNATNNKVLCFHCFV